MTCTAAAGCSCKRPVSARWPKRTRKPSPGCCKVSDVDRTALMVCMTCPHARASGFHACTISGLPVAQKVCDGSIVATAMRRNCPLGLTPDARGRVRWLDLEWMGVPFPRRLLLAWPLRLWWGTPRLKRELEGCGCHREPKVIWRATVRKVRRWLA